jgi:hypothetical protein
MVDLGVAGDGKESNKAGFPGFVERKKTKHDTFSWGSNL